MTDTVGVVLAGGRSTRMGRDKALIELAGETLLARAVRRLAPQVGPLVVNSNGDAGGLVAPGLPVVADTATGYQGPLAGIHTGLLWARANAPASDYAVCVAVDTPFFPDDLVARLLAAAAPRRATVAIAASGGHLHPTFGLYPVSLADDIALFLAAGERRVQDFLARQGAIPVEFVPPHGGAADVDPFFNVNTPAELAAAERWLARPV